MVMKIEVNGRKQIAYMIFCHAIITFVNNCVLWGFRLAHFVGNICSCNVLLPEGIQYMKEITYMSGSYLSYHLMQIEILNELLF